MSTSKWRSVAAAQDGLITRRQALACGLSDQALAGRVRGEAGWQVVLPAVYATFGGALTSRQRVRAALLAAGDDAVLGGATACSIHGLRYVPIAPIVLLVPDHRRPLRDRRATRRRLVMAPDEVRVQRTTRAPRSLIRNGLPVVTLDRAVVDAGRASRSLRDVRALICEAVQRRLATAAALEIELAAGPSAGGRLVRRVLAEVAAGIRSAPEGELRDLMESSAVLPPAQYNGPPITVRTREGRSRRYVPDATLEAALLLVECDSVEHHASATELGATLKRHSELESLGYCVLHVTPAQLRGDPAGTLALIEQTYLRRIVQLTAARA